MESFLDEFSKGDVSIHVGSNVEVESTFRMMLLWLSLLLVSESCEVALVCLFELLFEVLRVKVLIILQFSIVFD